MNLSDACKQQFMDQYLLGDSRSWGFCMSITILRGTRRRSRVFAPPLNDQAEWLPDTGVGPASRRGDLVHRPVRLPGATLGRADLLINTCSNSNSPNVFLKSFALACEMRGGRRAVDGAPSLEQEGREPMKKAILALAVASFSFAAFAAPPTSTQNVNATNSVLAVRVSMNQPACRTSTTLRRSAVREFLRSRLPGRSRRQAAADYQRPAHVHGHQRYQRLRRPQGGHGLPDRCLPGGPIQRGVFRGPDLGQLRCGRDLRGGPAAGAGTW